MFILNNYRIGKEDYSWKLQNNQSKKYYNQVQAVSLCIAWICTNLSYHILVK